MFYITFWNAALIKKNESFAMKDLLSLLIEIGVNVNNENISGYSVALNVDWLKFFLWGFMLKYYPDEKFLNNISKQPK